MVYLLSHYHLISYTPQRGVWQSNGVNCRLILYKEVMTWAMILLPIRKGWISVGNYLYLVTWIYIQRRMQPLHSDCIPPKNQLRRCFKNLRTSHLLFPNMIFLVCVCLYINLNLISNLSPTLKAFFYEDEGLYFSKKPKNLPKNLICHDHCH